jgi:hypothetical protein
MPPPDRSQLQDLVDDPTESLTVEYKSWLDLKDNAVRANLARHIAALANHGGGAIVFGITDQMLPQGGTPIPVSRDTISGIVKRYLEPPFQCEVVLIQSAAGNEHPVVIVPPHGASPICAKAGGPIVKGRSQGIVQGTYYLRKPGPASEPILTGVEWAPLIRRCAMHERAAILGAIDAALRGAPTTAPDEPAILKNWHDAAREAFLALARGQDRLPPLDKNHWEFSYSITTGDGQQLDPNKLSQTLREVNAEVQDLVRTGWSMFYQFGRDPIQPYFNTDPKSGLGESDFLECALLRDAQPRILGMDFWRVSPSGRVSLVREYREDSPEFAGDLNMTPGTVFSPNILAQSLAEFVRHARGLAERFTEATAVFFRCEWWGLEGRVAADPTARWYPGQSTASRTSHRVSSGSWPVGSLNSNLSEIVAALGSPVARAFDFGHGFTPQWVEGQRGRWLHL